MTAELVQAIVFYFLTAMVVISVSIVVFARNIVHCVFALFFALLGLAGYYAMLHADFLAVTQVVVYVGGILALLIFGILLTAQTRIVLGLPSRRHYVLTTLVGALVFAGLLMVIQQVSTLPISISAEVQSTVEPLGDLLLGRDPGRNFLFLFEFSSLTLLVALVGAAYLVRRGDR